MAIFLARRGCEVEVYEARPDLRYTTVGGHRSINLTIATRGLDALRRVGLDGQVLDKLCTVLHSRVVHDRNGRLRNIPYGVRSHEVLHAVSRTELLKFLLDVAATEPGVRLHFQHRCVELDKASATTLFLDQRTGERRTVSADLVIGADGVYSVIRGRMQRREPVDFSQHFVPWRYKEFTIRPVDGEISLDTHALHVWPRGDFMMFALPNRDLSFNGVCVLPAHGPNSFDELTEPDEVRAFFEAHFADAVPYMPRLIAEFFDRPANGFPTIRTSSWHHGATVVLIGDACHGVVPFYGQGMNAAFEDCVVLDECLAEHWRDWGAALRQYEHRRRVHTDVLADLSIANFTELRAGVMRPSIAARKQVLRIVHRVFGDRAAPLYSLVSHSTTPYADCVRVARGRERIGRLLGADVLVAAIVAQATVRQAIRTRVAASTVRVRGKVRGKGRGKGRTRPALRRWWR